MPGSSSSAARPRRGRTRRSSARPPAAATPLEHGVERAVGAAVGVGDRDRVVAPRSRSSSATAGAIRSGRLCSSAGSG